MLCNHFLLIRFLIIINFMNINQAEELLGEVTVKKY